ncbi:hypothetical protein IQ07DRAFT_216512 [Pyrenochaeta sp. DS3sAY3a]|nr:hypothetical protein IQ07DRAFT_216512 [Pyrenochaeta sp. DS3sAY3a]
MPTKVSLSKTKTRFPILLDPLFAVFLRHCVGVFRAQSSAMPANSPANFMSKLIRSTRAPSSCRTIPKPDCRCLNCTPLQISRRRDKFITMSFTIRIPKDIWNSYNIRPHENEGHNQTATGLTIRVPIDIWNSYDPLSPGIQPAPRPRPNLRLPNMSDFATHGTETNNEDPSPVKRRHCQVRFVQFGYGGPKRQRGGQWQNQITYETPCLSPSCKNCQKWHAHLLSPSPEASMDVDKEIERILGKRERLKSPPVDPRILDGTWRDVKSGEGNEEGDTDGSIIDDGVSDCSGRSLGLTPVDRTFARHTTFQKSSQSPESSTPQFYESWYHPGPQSDDGSDDSWVPESERQHMVRLAFTSRQGKQKYRSFVERDQLGKEHIIQLSFTSRVGKRRYRALVQRLEHPGEKEESSIATSSPAAKGWTTVGAKSEGNSSSAGRSRHRLRLVFKTARGQQAFAEEVGRRGIR